MLRQVDHAGPAMPALVEVIRQAGTRVAVIPNSGRVALLAEAAAARLAGEGIDVSVVPARSALQGLAALAVHDPRRAFGEDVAAMGRPPPDAVRERDRRGQRRLHRAGRR